LPRKVFVAGEILTAADVNANLMDQAVMVFDDSTARGSAIPSPSEGMVTYLKDTDALEKYTTAWEAVTNAGIGSNVVQTVKSDTFTTTSTSFVDITSFSVSITPTSASSKVLVLVDLAAQGVQASRSLQAKLLRGSTDIYVGDTAGSRTRAALMSESNSASTVRNIINFLDSPATTSSTTYKVQIRTNTAGQLVYVNRTVTDTDSDVFVRVASSITAIEVAA
jgi:hypothetical protein